MIKRILTVSCMLLLFIFAETVAQTLPSAHLISPGMVKWLKTADNADNVRFNVTASVDQLFHIRDMSVINSILSFISIESTGAQNTESDASNLKVTAGGEIISDITYLLADGVLKFLIGEKQYAIPLSEFGTSYFTDAVGCDFDKLRNLFVGKSCIERMDLHAFSEMLQTGELFQLFPEFRTENIQVLETYSDDGIWLKRLNIDGYLYYNNELWSVNGSIAQPNGESPKDTADFRFYKDEKNKVYVTLSSKYSLEKGKKNQNGAISSNCRINISGIINGFDVKYIIGLKIRNDWSADGTYLFEKLTIAPSINWTDKTPGRKYLHLNNGSLNTKNVVQLVSNESSETVSGGSNALSIELKMDGEYVIKGTLGMRFEVNDGILTLPEKGSIVNKGTFFQLADLYTRELSRKIIQHIDEKNKKKIKQGI